MGTSNRLRGGGWYWESRLPWFLLFWRLKSLTDDFDVKTGFQGICDKSVMASWISSPWTEIMTIIIKSIMVILPDILDDTELLDVCTLTERLWNSSPIYTVFLHLNWVSGRLSTRSQSQLMQPKKSVRHDTLRLWVTGLTESMIHDKILEGDKRSSLKPTPSSGFIVVISNQILLYASFEAETSGSDFRFLFLKFGKMVLFILEKPHDYNSITLLSNV